MVLGFEVKIKILNILSESKRLELKFSLKIAFMFLAEDLTWQIGDRVRGPLVRKWGPWFTNHANSKNLFIYFFLFLIYLSCSLVGKSF